VFRGVTTLNLDAKGRFAIPTRHRERLQTCCDSKLVATVDRDGCLLLYPEPEWVEIERKLKNLPSFNKRARALQRLYIGHAQEGVYC
jgi:MraZ protein